MKNFAIALLFLFATSTLFAQSASSKPRWFSLQWSEDGEVYYTLACSGKGSLELGWATPVEGGAWDSKVATELGDTWAVPGTVLPRHASLAQAKSEVARHIDVALCTK